MDSGWKLRTTRTLIKHLVVQSITRFKFEFKFKLYVANNGQLSFESNVTAKIPTIILGVSQCVMWVSIFHVIFIMNDIILRLLEFILGFFVNF